MSQPTRTVTVGIPIYDGVDLLDLAAPKEAFRWVRDHVPPTVTVNALTVAKDDRAVTTRDGLRILPDLTFDALPAMDVLWVPGGNLPELQALMADETFLEQLRLWAGGADYVCSVCEGAMLLAAAGLLDGYRATTHWAFLPCLRQYPNITVMGGHDGWWPRFIVDPEESADSGGRLTGGGVSSGIDESLKLIELLFDRATAEAVQVSMQYFPDPPVCGTLPATTECPM